MAKFDLLSDSDFIEIVNSCSQWNELSEKFGYKSTLSSNLKKKVLKRCETLNVDWKQIVAPVPIGSKTKGEIFSSHKNWQSARSDIRKDASRIFNNSGKDKCCAICGYNKTIQVAHIKAVSEFDNSTLIKDINCINNLVPLCPNHHWEFDNGLLSEEDLRKIQDFAARN